MSILISEDGSEYLEMLIQKSDTYYLPSATTEFSWVNTGADIYARRAEKQ